jgi:ElaB/YqjD/DUF883 family membrane-anchored ribosome-binding protein
MENSITNNFGKTSQALADKAADKVQAGIRGAQDTAKDAGNALSGKIDELRTEAGPALTQASNRARSTARQGWDSITDTARQARDVTSNAADSIVSYTKKNPAMALAIAAASGALLYAAIKALAPSRD